MKLFRSAALIAAFLFAFAPLEVAAQVTPANGTPVISASVPGGYFNIYPYLSGVSMGGIIKFAFFTASCTPAAATTCTTTATQMFPTTGTINATQFAAAPFCFDGQNSSSVATVIGAGHVFNGSFTTDTITLTASASTSSLLAGTFFCVGP